MQTKGCCKGNNYEQRFALDPFLLVVLAKLFHFMAPFLAMAKLELGSAHGLSKALYFVVYLAARL